MKHLLTKASLAALLIMIGIIACKKNNSDSITNPGTNPGNTISTTVVGRIVNDQNQPVAGAVIKAGTSTVTTDVNGVFRINGASLSENTAFVSVEKSGYFSSSRTFYARANQKNYVEIMLLPKQNVGTISGTSGGTITLGNGSAITLQAGGVVTTSSGSAYTGSVNVAMAWINPTSADMYRQMPGDLRGMDATNTEVGMQSFGMLGVELTGSGGEKLQIANGKKASLKFPLPTAIQGTAPSTIALWSFNDTTGLWKQEGTATKSGNFYLADVSHFSFWNCDAYFPLARFSATLVSQANQPLQHVWVRIKRPNGSYTTGVTDSTGYITGQVPSNESLVMEVLANYSCNAPIYSQNIGPFTTNSTTSLGTITITLSAATTTTLTGSVVNCSSAAVTNGYVDVKVGFSSYRANLSSAGTFTLQFTTCSPTSQITYYAVDNATNQQSAPVTATVNAGTNSLAAISACGISTARFINYSFDGTNYVLTAPTDSLVVYSQGASITVSGSTGNNGLNSIYFSFNGNGVGTYPLTSLSAGGYYVLANSTNVTTTEYSASVGGYIAGSFSAVLKDSATLVTHPVQCTFRVRR